MAKKAKVLAFNTWEQVDGALKELATLGTMIAEGEALMNKEIDRIKSIYDEKCKSLLGHQKVLEANIKEFTKSRISEFTDSKSRKFMFGEVGFRKTTKITAKNVKAILEALKQNKMHDCIDVTESLNKDKLSEYDDASIEKIGAKRKVEDKFYYKIDTERIEG